MNTAYLVYCANTPGYPHFPESSLALAGELKKMDIPSAIIDLRLIDVRSIAIKDPLFFGFTVYSNESIARAIDFARKVRKRFPGVVLAWGGPHVHMMPEQTASHELVDIACYGEGEITVKALAQAVLNGKRDFSTIPGIVFKNGTGLHKTPPAYFENLDNLDFYPYELLDLDRYKKTIHTHFYYQTSRGCTHRCRFCNYNYQYRWRGKSSQKVVEEITRIIARFHPYEWYISDGNFFADKKRVAEILEKLKAVRLDSFRWSAFCRFDDLCTLPDALLRLMKDTGCFQLNLGGESGSDKILRYLNKGITAAQIIHGVRRCNEAGIRVEVSFFAGTPPETPEDLDKTIDMVLKIYSMHPDNLVNGLYYYQPYPNTPLMEEITHRYRIPLPRDLETWGTKPITAPYREYLPWLSRRAYTEIFSLTQIVNFLYLRKRLELYLEENLLDKKFRVLFLLSALLLPLARLRLLGKNFRFAVEWKLYYLLKKKILYVDL